MHLDNKKGYLNLLSISQFDGVKTILSIEVNESKIIK